MIRKRKITLVLFSLAISATMGYAQQSRQFTISGTMTNDSLRYTPAKIEKLYLCHEVNGQQIKLDSTIVKNKSFKFTATAPEFVETYHITGFDNGSIQFFAEPGEIKVLPFSAKFPVGADVSGTPANDVLHEFNKLNSNAMIQARERLSNARKTLPENILNDDKAFMPYHRSIYFTNSVDHRAQMMEFVCNHLDSPVSLYVMRYSLFHLFGPKALERQLLRAVPYTLRSHPLYNEMVNMMRSANMVVGSVAPELSGKTPDGKTVTLEDLKGKYVFIDFWASWCAPCRREFPFMKQAMKESENASNFVILSFSIDDKEKDWTNCIARNELTHKNWIHISTLQGWNSPAVKLYNVSAVPRTVLINPKGQIIAFDLRGEEMLKKVTNIMKGEESYE
ncbi:MAG: thioredoxin-like domain-containing protein [Prevotella sp.]|jgi:thiol-disulfide isomerase/thioredoxin